MTTIFFELDSDASFNNFTSLSRICVLYFSASWCGPCKRIAPILNQTALDSELSKDIYKFEMHDTETTTINTELLKRSVMFLKIDVDEFQDIANIFNIKSVPTVVFYVNGNLFMADDKIYKVPNDKDMNKYVSNILNFVSAHM